MLIALTISIIINIFLIWYSTMMIKKLWFVSDNIGDLLETLEDFSKHIEQVYEMELFYGDPTLDGLLKHSQEIVREIESYREIYNIANDEVEFDETEEEEEK